MKVVPVISYDVFTLMKPGASFLFIDNAGGEFYELVLNAASRCGFSSSCGPYRHMKYEHEAFRRKMFGTFGLSCTTVAVQMWEKKCFVALNAYESQLISEHLLDRKMADISSYPHRDPLHPADSKPQKNNRRRRRRNRSASRTRNHSAALVSDDSKRSELGETSVCSSATEWSRNSQAVESRSAQYNQNNRLSSISGTRCSKYLITESDSCGINANGPNIIQTPPCSSPVTSSTTSQDFDAHNSSSESVYSSGQYKHSDHSQKSRYREQHDDCCCVVS